MPILASLYALLTLANPARLGRRAEHTTLAASVTRVDDVELLAIATAIGVVRDLTPAAAAPALSGAV